MQSARRYGRNATVPPRYFLPLPYQGRGRGGIESYRADYAIIPVENPL